MSRRALDTEEKRLYCANCGTTFPIIDGVPRFVSSEHYADSFGIQWNIHRQAQLDSHTGLPLSRDRYNLATHWPENLKGETILEAGSGAGRFTEVLATTGADVLSFDLSSAVNANYANNGHRPNVLIFQRDIFNIPVYEQSMDKVLGVIQHTHTGPRGSFSQPCTIRAAWRSDRDRFLRIAAALGAVLEVCASSDHDADGQAAALQGDFRARTTDGAVVDFSLPHLRQGWLSHAADPAI
jgi:SAM-dependent methyltransferase